jgi:hypothetical protein
MAATGTETVGPAPKRTQRSTEATYVVQVEIDVRDDPGHKLYDGETWEDVATVTVPARTKRKRVIALGLEKAGMEVKDAIRVRALDEESAAVIPVAPFQPPAQLKIG